ncbi:MAG: hypothetical protein ABIL68_02475 [bacterium]
MILVWNEAGGGTARQRAAMAAFYRRFFRPGELCFDVGANRGNRTAILSDLGARVIYIEPQPSCVRELRKRFGRNANVEQPTRL